jgi:hypothetical protein
VISLLRSTWRAMPADGDCDMAADVSMRCFRTVCPIRSDNNAK